MNRTLQMRRETSAELFDYGEKSLSGQHEEVSNVKQDKFGRSTCSRSSCPGFRWSWIPMDVQDYLSRVNANLASAIPS
ncbi:hypothetical protein LshimejAT787_0506670 [Lyophyllum shimeji]|uniref:Uncharacterized protein n=1 Tax=Lyophyllum shimeji TaxID=47721 RepID=A0A9P3UMY9_LYOSH|nr:hypothetical protein LshimejAT787_0506670 [Lyophyllum shimeji]